jgi:serine/threonine protein kinase
MLVKFQHLINISPFNSRWEISKTLSAGTYGTAFEVEDNKTRTKAVIKVVRAAVAESGGANKIGEWEAFVLEKLFKAVS